MHNNILTGIAFDVIFLPNKYSPTLWIAKNTTILYRDGDRTAWFLPNISISRHDFLLGKLHYRDSEEFLSKIASPDLGFLLNKASTLNLHDRNLKYLQLPNQVIPFLMAKNVDFTGANFSSVVLTGAHISKSIFDGADLSFADFGGSQIFQTNITDSILGGANFRGAVLGLMKITNSSMGGNTLEGARIQHSNFKNINLVGAKLSGTRLVNVTFENIDLPEDQYVFDGYFFDNTKDSKINLNEKQALKAIENVFCDKPLNTLRKIKIHRILQIKNFESNEIANQFKKQISLNKKCKNISEYYSATTIDMFDYFRK